MQNADQPRFFALLSHTGRPLGLFFFDERGDYGPLSSARLWLQRVQAPAVIQRYLRETTSYTVSGDDTRGEGGDFILEAKNRETKAWIPHG